VSAGSGRERGVALFVMLVFMVVLGLLGSGSLQGALLAEKLTRRQLDRLLALQAAEATLHDAELDLEGRRLDGSFCVAGEAGCRPAGERPIAGAAGLSYFNALCGSAQSRGQCLRREDAYFATPVWRDASLLELAARYGQYTATPPYPEVVRQPRYLIEGFRKAPGYVFRITVEAYGMHPSTRVMLQSLYLISEAS